jgi:hypothetical protein
VKRVVGSIVAAETLSLQMALSPGIFRRAVLSEILEVKGKRIPIVVYIDSNNLYQAMYSSKFVDDKRLRMYVAEIQE